MDADTKCGEVLLDTGQDSGPSVRMRVTALREQLATQGLHVVTAADKAVLDAWSAVPTETLWLWANHMSAHVCNTCRAELARREALRGR